MTVGLTNLPILRATGVPRSPDLAGGPAEVGNTRRGKQE